MNTNPILFSVGELRMIQVERRSLLSNWWTSEDTLRNFCCSTIQLAIENLVLNKVFTISTVDAGTKILFFKISDFADYLEVSDPNIEELKLGLIEQHIITKAKSNSAHTAADYVHTLVHALLPNSDYYDPGREIINTILLANRFEYWQVENKKGMFSSKVKFKIDEANEDRLVSDLNNIVKPIIVERNCNKQFRDFSNRLYNVIHSSLKGKLAND